MKPILFNTAMVQAILDGRKTVTRRVLAQKEVLDKYWGLDREPYTKNGKWYYDSQTHVDDCRAYELKPKYRVGDILYVRETWCEVPYESDTIPIKGGHVTMPKYAYKATSKIDYSGMWRPSIHMPKEAARIFLRVTDVRVEMLQDITEEQAIKEGAMPVPLNDVEFALAINNFAYIWDSTLPPNKNKFKCPVNDPCPLRLMMQKP